uniref:Uncharacterized protein n=1 Tax=Romanomermis culicivorax TaxID=13658 RepID=A0A915JAZ4_ROMCU
MDKNVRRWILHELTLEKLQKERLDIKTPDIILGLRPCHTKQCGASCSIHTKKWHRPAPHSTAFE